MADAPQPPAPGEAAPTRAEPTARKYLRQPIVSVLGHVDHGKTSLLDRIRGGSVAKREPGAITQHIGATEVPIETIYKILGPLAGAKRFNVSGLLFIDTPGHHSFNALRARGGALADIAVLVIDYNEGLMPQTLEAIRILRRFKTPFVIAANKIDLQTGYESKPTAFGLNFKKQTETTQQAVDNRIYEILGRLFQEKLPADRYDRISDFTKTIALVPCSAKTGEGLPDLLLVLVGLAQRFLEERLTTEEGPGVGTVLEVKEERGLGLTLDAIIYGGTLRASDRIGLGGKNGPVVTSIRALLKPKALDEIRDPREPFAKVREVHAASGIKIAAPNLEDVLPGAPLRVLRGRPDEEILDEIRQESEIQVPIDDTGICIKADTLGSLEALANELRARGAKIRRAGVGDVSRRDVIDAATSEEPLDRLLLGFTVKLLPDAEREKADRKFDVVTADVIYHLLDEYDAWKVRAQKAKDESEREEYVHPASVKYLSGKTFRVSNPAVIGVRVLAGRIKPGQHLLKDDGRVVGPIKSIQSEGKTVAEAIQGAEVAIALDGVTVGRQIHEDEVLFVDLPGGHAKVLFQMEKLSMDERDVLEKVSRIKRRTEKFWGM
ncbi:MAG: translation initiation factor IF-2 [Euryarchaeota archaeon]|nr:translation initiation factor IF-2 [Euryarchaeota archaeon]